MKFCDGRYFGRFLNSYYLRSSFSPIGSVGGESVRKCDVSVWRLFYGASCKCLAKSPRYVKDILKGTSCLARKLLETWSKTSFVGGTEIPEAVAMKMSVFRDVTL